MRARSAFAFLVAGAAALGLAAAGCGGSGSRPAAGKGTTTGSEWTFTVEQGAIRIVAPPPPPSVTRKAKRIAGRDASLRRLLAHSAIRVVKSGNWISVDDGKPLGANLVFRLPHVIAVDADLPYVVIPPDTPAGRTCPHPYARGWLHERSAGVDELGVLVDVHRRAVVAIDTNARSGTRSWVPGRPHPRCGD